jgi:hypothetical protein
MARNDLSRKTKHSEKQKRCYVEVFKHMINTTINDIFRLLVVKIENKDSSNAN